MIEAEGLAEQVMVDSAGTGDWHIGHCPDPRTLRVAAIRGYSLEHLVARQVCAEDFAVFDYILAMDLANLANLKAAAPANFRGELRLFLDYAPSPAWADESERREVPDPYNGGVEDFEQVLTVIERASEGLIKSVKSQRLALNNTSQIV